MNRSYPHIRHVRIFAAHIMLIPFIVGLAGIAQAQSNSRFFPETGHTVKGQFLDYWNSHGGLAQQGYPISEEFQEKSDLDGKTYTVQYFERAVFELHPENQPPYDVLLSQLGTFRYRQLYASGAPPAPPGGITGGDWTMYGYDQQRTNYNPNEHTINAGNINQLVSRWQIPIDNAAHPGASSPVVANGRVYVGTGLIPGNNLYAIDAKTGAQVWAANLGYLDTCFRVGIGSTAAVSGDVVVVGGGDGAYYGLDANTGARLWTDDTAASAGAFAWVSPLILNGQAYIGIASYCDKPQVRGELREVDMKTGSLTADRYFVPEGHTGATVWNSPALSADSKTLVVATGEERTIGDPLTRALISLDPQSLNVLQSNRQGHDNLDEDWGTTPIIFHDSTGKVLVGANHKDNVFYAYDLNNIQAGPVWQKEINTFVGLMPAYDPTYGDGGTLFIAGTHGMLYTVDPANGNERRSATRIGTAHGNIAIANGLMFINQDRTGLKVIDEKSGQTLRTLIPNEPVITGSVRSGVAVANGFIYWLSNGYLNAWSLPAP